MCRKLIGQSMIEARLISKEQLNWLLQRQKAAGERVLFGRLTVEFDIVTETELASFLASYFGVPYVDLEKYLMVQEEALDTVPESLARRLNVLPLVRENGNLTVAISDPLDLTAIENLKTVTHCRIKPVVSSPTQIRYSIDVMYQINKEKEEQE